MTQEKAYDAKRKLANFATSDTQAKALVLYKTIF